MKFTTLRIVACLLLTLSVTIAWGQKDKEKEKVDIEALVKSKNYTFIANSVTPMGSRARALTGLYDLTLKGDTLIVFLPYFGKAHTAPMPGEDGGIKFTSIDFSYTVTQSKGKTRWDVEMVPNDQKNGEKLSLQVFSSGTASLQVQDNRRQSISFHGRVGSSK